MSDASPTFHVPDPPEVQLPSDESGGPPRWSAMAITGFVLSFLLVLAPIGVLLGIGGIFRTRGGRRRGMGLAIAAIPIGMVVSGVVGVLILFAFTVTQMQSEATHVASALRSSRVTIQEKTNDFYEHFHRFESTVPRRVFSEWLTTVIDSNGSMTSWKVGQPPIEPRQDGSWTFRYTGAFVNVGTADVAVTFFPAGWRDVELRDLVVDGVSVVASNRPVGVGGS